MRKGSFGFCLAFSVLSYPQARILELIGLVQHRELTASLLDLNDQMNNQLLRFFSLHHHDISKKNYFRFERYKNNTSAERGAVKSPVSSDDAFSPDEVLMTMMNYSVHAC